MSQELLKGAVVFTTTALLLLSKMAMWPNVADDCSYSVIVACKEAKTAIVEFVFLHGV